MINTSSEILTNNRKISILLSRDWKLTEGQTLHWKQPKRLKGEYQLHSPDHIWGTLKYEGNNFYRRASAKTADIEWAFKYTRFSLPKVTIKRENNQVAQFIYEINWGWRGSLTLSDGCKFTWKPTDHNEKEYCFVRQNNHPILFLRPRNGFFKSEAEVEITPADLRKPHLPLLTMLGWFLVLLRKS